MRNTKYYDVKFVFWEAKEYKKIPHIYLDKKSQQIIKKNWFSEVRRVV